MTKDAKGRHNNLKLSNKFKMVAELKCCAWYNVDNIMLVCNVLSMSTCEYWYCVERNEVTVQVRLLFRNLLMLQMFCAEVNPYLKLLCNRLPANNNNNEGIGKWKHLCRGSAVRTSIFLVHNLIHIGVAHGNILPYGEHPLWIPGERFTVHAARQTKETYRFKVNCTKCCISARFIALCSSKTGFLNVCV